MKTYKLIEILEVLEEQGHNDVFIKKDYSNYEVRIVMAGDKVYLEVGEIVYNK